MLANEIDAINTEVDLLLEQNKLRPMDNGKIMFAIRQSIVLKKMAENERIANLFEFIFGQPVVAFQTINF